MPTPIQTATTRLATAVLAVSLLAAHAQTLPPSYPTRAPLEQYRIASPDQEIALAQSAAPKSIATQAEVLTLGPTGYQTAVKGQNGFVCLVLRGWATDFDDPGFWNPHVRAPICYNAAAVRTVLPTDLRRAQWALAGATQTEMATRTKAAIAAHQIAPPEVGAMAYMLSKQGYLNDQAKHWHPHLMFFLPRMTIAQWGANAPGGVIMGDADSLEPLTIFYVPLAKWSDGTAADAMAM